MSEPTEATPHHNYNSKVLTVIGLITVVVGWILTRREDADIVALTMALNLVLLGGVALIAAIAKWRFAEGE